MSCWRGWGSIGIINCQRQQRTVVAFALRDIHKPIGVATYPLTDTLPAELRPFFPNPRYAAASLPWRRHSGGWGGLGIY